MEDPNTPKAQTAPAPKEKLRLPYFPLFVDDFDEGVEAMSLAEVGLYLLSLLRAWKYGPIPTDPEQLARLIKRKPSDVKKAWPKVSRKWLELKPGELVNARQEVERAKAISKSLKAAASATIRHSSKADSSKASAMRSHNPGSANALPRVSESVSESSGEFVVSEKTNPEVSPAETALSIEKSAVGAVFSELKSIYQQAGKPIASKHEHLAIQLLLGIPEDRLDRVTNYVKWALVSGTWSDAAHTKSLLNLLRDGDWDVELTQRTLPQVAENRVKKAQDEARRQFIEGA